VNHDLLSISHPYFNFPLLLFFILPFAEPSQMRSAFFVVQNKNELTA